MDYGLCLPNYRAGSSREGIDAAAEAAERAGWSTVWTTDHLIVEAANAREYGRIFDAILTLAWVGARHESIRVGTSVIVVPHRNAAILAKELATLDVLTNGRVMAGVGIGWDQPEFANLGALDRFRVRGAYLDEAIVLWRHLWSGSREPFEGRFHALTDFEFDPLPVQGASLPILVGGGSDAALARAGRLGDGWQATAAGPDVVSQRMEKVRVAAEAAGRPMPRLSARVRVRLGETTGQGYALRGSAEQAAADVRAFADLGVEHLALAFEPTDATGITAAVERFSSEVEPLVREALAAR
jgi:probable F420-dependent oxidoreductase